jgi:hypothetical protein
MQFKTKLGLVDIPNAQVVAAARDIAAGEAPAKTNSTAVEVRFSDLAGARSGTAEMDFETAWALAQFLKRCSWSTCERLSEPGRKDETQRMIDAVCILQRALAGAGISPR